MKPAAPVDRTSLLVSLIILALLILIAGGMGVYVVSDPGILPAYHFARAAFTVADGHVGPVHRSRLIAAARQAMFDRLDRYSAYLEKDQLDWMEEELSGHYGGIGVSVVKHDRGLLIMSVREGGPAAAAGVLAGDVIIGADSIELAHISADSAANILRGEEGTDVLVRLFRPSLADTVEVLVTREQVPLLHVPFAGFTSDSVFYIRVLDFEAGCTEDLRAALDSVLLPAAATCWGIILDLRGNPGGLFAEAFETADLFLEKGKFVVGTDARSRWQEKRFYTDNGDVTGGLPLAVLVNRGSASSAEIVAGALQQTGRAVLVGDTTFGKGLVQGFTRFADGDGVRLTIARYYFGDRVYLNDFDSVLNDVGTGLPPDYYIPSGERDPFVRALEGSLVLQQLAGRYHDELIESLERGALDSHWIDLVADEAGRADFAYRASVTITAEAFLHTVTQQSASSRLQAAASRLVDRCRVMDKRRFYRCADYIKLRLKQIACERRYGMYRTYRDVIVPGDTVIQFAAGLLLER